MMWRRCLIPLTLCLLSAIIISPAHASRPEKSAADKEREAWEKLIEFYGDEATNDWSLRIEDKNVTKRATFVFLELWRYDSTAKKWDLVDQPHMDTAIVLPKDKPADKADEDTQILYNLTEIQKGMYGLWFAKWRADGVSGANFIRLGPARAPRKGGEDERPPTGWLWEVVPLNLNKAEMQMIPEPHVWCTQDAPATQPVK